MQRQEQAVSDLAQAESLFFAGEYRRSLALLEQQPPSGERFLLAARTLSRMGDHDAVLHNLRAGEQHFHTHEQRGLADAQAAFSYAASGLTLDAEATLARLSAAPAVRLAKPARLEIAYTLARCAWVRGELTQARKHVADLDGTSDPTFRAKALAMKAWIAASEQRFVEQAVLIEQAIKSLLSASVRDVGLIANLGHTLAVLGRELFLPRISATIETLVRFLPWPRDLGFESFQTFRASAWANALQANYITGIRQLEAAKDLAPTDHYRVLSRFDHSLVAFIAGEVHSARAQLLEAEDLARRIAWDHTAGEERATLLVGAEVLAQADPVRAKWFLDKFDGMSAPLGLQQGFRHGTRLAALHAYAQAAVAAASGDVALARRSAKFAYDAYDAIEYDWRAARAALLLYKSGLGDDWLAAAQRKIESYPRSYIALEVQAFRRDGEDQVLRLLTPRQREIALLLAEGVQVDALSAKLRMSPNTAKAHITRIHRALGVRNRAELVRAIVAPQG